MPRHAETLPLFGQEDPDIRALVPRASAVVAEHRIYAKSGAFEPRAQLRNRQRAERELEAMAQLSAAAPLDVFLLECREAAAPILTDRFDERQSRPAFSAAAQLHFVVVLPPLGAVWYQIDAERGAGFRHVPHRRERRERLA